MSNKNVFQDPRSIDNPVIYVGKSDSSDSECGAWTSPMCPLDPDICTVFPDSWRLQILWVFFIIGGALPSPEWHLAKLCARQYVLHKKLPSSPASSLCLPLGHTFLLLSCLFSHQSSQRLIATIDRGNRQKCHPFHCSGQWILPQKKLPRPALQHLHTKYSGRHNDSPTTYLSCIYRRHWFDT